MRFNDKLARLMAQHSLTQEVLAAALGTSQPTVARWLKDSKPRRSAALSLADYFGIPVEVLLDDHLELPVTTTVVKEHGGLEETQEMYEAPMSIEDFAAKYPEQVKGLVARLLGMKEQGSKGFQIMIKGHSTYAQKPRPSKRP